MDAISPNAPTVAAPSRPIRQVAAAAALAVTAVGMLGAGYALGTRDDSAPAARFIAGSQPTLADAARESRALKQRAHATPAAGADIRYERVR